MANLDKPMGWIPIAIRGGGGSTPMQTMNNKGSEAIYQYDALTVAAGVVDPLDQGEATIGVSSMYSADTADLPVTVYSDPDQVYRVQADDVSSALTSDALRYTHYDISASTGDTTTLYSLQELDANDSADDLFIIYDLLPVPGNAWGDNCEVYGSFLEHQGRPVPNLASQ